MKDSYWIKSGAYSLLQRFFIVLFGFGGFYILIRLFSKEQFGVWMLFISVTSFTDVLRQGLIKNAAVKYLVSSSVEEKPKVVSAVLLLSFLTTVLIGVVLFSISGLLSRTWNAPELDIILKIYIITSFAYILFYHFEYIQQANFNFQGTFYAYFAKQGAFFLFILFYFLTNRELTLTVLAIGQVCTVLVGAIVAYLFTKKYLIYGWNFDKSWLRKLFDFGKYTFGTNISTMIFGNIDQWMLAYLISPVSVAIYNPAIRVTNLVEVPTNSVASIVFPKVSERLAESGKGAAKHLYEKSVGVILALLVPGLLFITLFTEFVVTFIAGENYTETIPILQVTIMFSLFVPFARQFGTILDGMGLPKMNFFFILFQALINVVFNYLFISQFGVIGAAFGTLCTYLTGFIFNQIYLNRIIKTSPLNVVKQMFLFYRDAWFYVINFLKKFNKGK